MVPTHPERHQTIWSNARLACSAAWLPCQLDCGTVHHVPTGQLDHVPAALTYVNPEAAKCNWNKKAQNAVQMITGTPATPEHQKSCLRQRPTRIIA